MESYDLLVIGGGSAAFAGACTPTMSEAIKMVAQAFARDMPRLSCCAAYHANQFHPCPG